MSAVDRAVRALEARAHGRVSRDEPLGPFTSYRLGGPAAVFLDAATSADLEALADAVAASGLDVLVVGRGSNMLVSDRGFPGIGVRLGAGFRWSEVSGSDLRAGAATPLPAVATTALHHGLAGVEFVVAIPASLGGAVRMNAGAHGREMADVVTDAVVFDLETSSERVLSTAELGFAYRTSRISRSSIVTGATLHLSPGTKEEITARMNEAKEWRRATQPINLPNGGSVFKNPAGDKAGRLIEVHCGKGLRVGGARISEVHANFIVADEQARADDVYTLMRRIQRRVLEQAGVALEPELKLMGEFEEVPDGSLSE